MMKNNSGKHLRAVLAAALVAAMLGSVGVAVAGQSSGGDAAPGAQQSRKHKKKHRGGKNQSDRGPRGKRGRRGPRGPRGPQGSPGPAGPAGMGVQFAQALPTNADPRTVFEQSGVRIEAGCSGGAVELTVRAVGGDHNIIEVTSFDNSENGKARGTTVPDIPVNIPVSMLSGGSGYHDYNGLLAVRSLSGELVTVQWFAMGSAFTSQGDCVVGGTASP